MAGARWGWRYLAGLVVAAGLAALLAGGVKAALLPGDQSWWRTTLAEGLAGAATAGVTLLFFDRLREQQAAKARRIHDIPLIAAVAASAHQLIEAWPENDGVPPDTDPAEAARNLRTPTIPDLSALAELALRSRDDLLATAEKLQALRRAGIGVLGSPDPDQKSTEAQIENLLNAVLDLNNAQFLIDDGWDLAPERRESRVSSGQMLLDSVLSMQTTHDRPAVLEAASALAQSIQSLRAKNQWAQTLEKDLAFGPVSKVTPEPLPLSAAMIRLTEVTGRAMRSLDGSQDVWAGLRTELDSAVGPFPNLLGFHVSLARTTARTLERTAQIVTLLLE